MEPVLGALPRPPCLAGIGRGISPRPVEFRQIDLFSQVPERLPLDQAAGPGDTRRPDEPNDSDKYPFLQVELDWIRRAIDGELPTLGICLGAQLMAKALGAKVYRNPVKEIGWYEIEMSWPLAERSASFSIAGRGRPSSSGTAIRSTCPRGGHSRRTTHCGNQVFRLGPRPTRVQFHVEMTPALMEQWLVGARF